MLSAVQHSLLGSQLACSTAAVVDSSHIAVKHAAAVVLAVQVTVDNETYDDRTIITVDSANRPGTLVEVVQCLTELGLNVKKARISSDGG